MNFVTSISLVVLGVMFLALLGWGSIRAAWRNCEGRRGVFAALAILAAICSIVAQKPSPDTPTITVDALLRDVGCYATNNVFHAAVTNAPSYAGVDFSDCDLMVYARERASTNAASWFELTPRKKFSQQPADYAIENATNYNYMVYLNYVPPSPVHTNGVFELYGFVIENEAQGEPDQLAAGFINSRAVPLPFDAEVEYLQTPAMTAANQYTTRIDTGISPTVDTEVFLDFLFINALAGDQICATRTGTAAANRFFVFASSSGGRVVLGNWATTNLGLIGQRHTILFNEYQTHHYYIDGVDKGAMGYTQYTKGNDNHLLLFATTGYEPSYGTSNSRIYSCRIRVGGVLVRDYIAVRKNGVGYMYDRVSGELFGNIGTGAFIVGPDK